MSTRSSEHILQSECVKWFRLQYPDKIIFAIPNGGLRNKIVAYKLKREGVLAGIPDLFIPEPNDKYCGLFIEMKVKYNKMTKKQKELSLQLKNRKYRVEVAYSIDEFINIVKKYFNE